MHETAARARFPLENVKTLLGSERFWEMRPGKGARECSESSISYVNRIIMYVVGKHSNSPLL